MTMLARALTALALALTGLVLAAPAPAFACRCQVGDLDRQVARADAIFVGTVDEVSGIRRGQAFEYTVTAREAFKGTVDREVLVTSKASSAACGLGALQAGTDYVFLVNGTAAPYTADSCSGSGPAAPRRLQKLEAVTGPARAIIPPAPETATRTRVEDSPPGSFSRLAAPGGAVAIVGLLGLVVVRRLARR
jgi:hypothetical protein